jgi:hypothetical protein
MPNELNKQNKAELAAEQGQRTFPDPLPVEKFQDAAVEYLRAKGWTVAVLGAVSVEHENPLDLNYRLTVRFTGRPPKGDEHVDRAQG